MKLRRTEVHPSRLKILDKFYGPDWSLCLSEPRLCGEVDVLRSELALTVDSQGSPVSNRKPDREDDGVGGETPQVPSGVGRSGGTPWGR